MTKKEYDQIKKFATRGEQVTITFWKPTRKKYFFQLMDRGVSFMSAYRQASGADNEELRDYDKGCMDIIKK